MFIVYLFAFLVLLTLITLAIKLNELRMGKIKVAKELQQATVKKIPSFGTVKNLRILPLIDFYADRKELRTEPGVSYLIQADDTKILLDVGYNEKKEHPSPLLQNMEKLNVSLNDLEMIFISHIHLDHIGGMKEQQERTFSISQGPVQLPEIPVFAPDNISPSKWNPAPKVNILRDPAIIKPGIASTGVIPRYLFIMGYTLEHSLVINVEGKGLVLIIGCGHQTIERIVEKVQQTFTEPIYAIIGGLHYPIKGGRIIKGPLDMQYIVGSDSPPWNGLNEKDVKQAVAVLKKVDPKIISLSAHDSSDWSIEQFKKAFENQYLELKVGKEIIV